MLSPGWANVDVNRVVGDRAWIGAALRVEGALARCQARFGIIPQDAADTIEAVADSLQVEPSSLSRGVYETSNPAISLIQQLQSAVDEASPGASDYVHLGATSQDILDSATMLVCFQALRNLQGALRDIRQELVRLIREHGATPMVGRTVSQHAVPMTFGVKVSTWLNVVVDAEREVRILLDAGLPLSLGGASGTLAAYGEYGTQVTGAPFDPFLLVDSVAEELGLSPHYQPWHTARTPIAKIAGTLAIVSGALGKIASDIHVMSRTEIGEVSEGLSENGGISSSMPQKRNPVKTALILAAARQVPAYTLVLFQAMVAEDERPAGAWQSEWQPLRDILRMVLGSSSHTAELVRNLRIDADRMHENLISTGAAVVSERLNVNLTPLVGKLKAKEILRRLLLGGGGDPATLVPKLRNELSVLGVHAEAIVRLLAADDYIGASEEIARRAIARSEAFDAPATSHRFSVRGGE
jgi:3-carboxy-cis,cis-muconate cycloisomerase